MNLRKCIRSVSSAAILAVFAVTVTQGLGAVSGSAAVPVTKVTAINALGASGAAGSNGWAFTEDDAPGVLSLSSAVSDPVNNDGSLFLATPTSAAHVIAQVGVTGAPNTLSGVSYQTDLEETGGAASISIQVGAFCTGTSQFTTFVFEPYLNPSMQAVTVGQWQTWSNATSGMWWSTHTFSGGGGQADVETFSSLMIKYMAACPAAQLVDIGVGMGSSNPGTAGWVDNLAYTTSAGSENWDFAAPAAAATPVTNVTAINALGASGAPGSQGWGLTEDDAPGVLDLNSVVNDPIHNDGAMYLATPTSPAHVVAQVAVTGAPNTLSGVGYQTFLGQTGGAASISIQVGAFCTGTSQFTTFVFEPYLNPTIQPIVTGQWQTWNDATTGMWWSTHTFAGGGGQADVEPFPQLMAAYMAACPNAQLVDIGLGMGSSNPGTAGWADNLAYTTSAGAQSWNFQAATTAAAPVIGTASAGNASASVAFTAPSNTGGSPIVSYTVTATDLTNSAHGGQTATGTSSPISITGLTNGDSYVFTVTATNSFGTGPASAPSNVVVPTAPPNPAARGLGYWLVAADGGIFSFGNAQFYGSTGALTLVQPIVGMSVTPDGKGYIMVASDGGVFTFGDAQYHGSAAGVATGPIVGIALTPDGGGYWMAGSNGEVYAFGDAKNLGPNQPTFLGSNVVGISSTGTGNGYWMVTAAGGIEPVGDAANFGQISGHLNKPIVGMAPTFDGKGYWLLGGDGGIFSFGDAQFHGSTGSLVLNKPVVGLTPTPDGGGYWLDASDGGIFSFGDAQFYGSTGSIKLNKPVVGMAAD
jgi:fibronectin type III domain protein